MATSKAQKKYESKCRAVGWKDGRRRGNLTGDMKKYGMTEMNYISMMIHQKNCCAGCSLHRSRFKERLHVDHDHKTKQVRQLLCGPCNRLLGKIEHNPLRAINMLKGVEFAA